MCKHSVINTGGNIYNDYIDMDDGSGRVIVVSCSGISLYANDRNYQLQVDPIVSVSSPEGHEAHCEGCSSMANYCDIGTVCDDCRRSMIVAGELEPCEPDSQIADLQSHSGYVFVRDIDGATMTVYRD